MFHVCTTYILFSSQLYDNMCIEYVDIDECDSNPCQNNATCNDGANGYTCTCPAGYTGPDCETGKYVYKCATWLSEFGIMYYFIHISKHTVK